MEAARERLTDTSEKLRLAFASLHAVNEEFAARTTGVGVLPLSLATSRVSRAAGTAKTVALSVLKAAEEAMAAATTARAAAVSSLAIKARAAARPAAGRAAVKVEGVAKATATVTLKSETDPPPDNSEWRHQRQQRFIPANQTCRKVKSSKTSHSTTSKLQKRNTSHHATTM